MDHSSIRSQMPTLVGPFVPRNSRRFKYRIYGDKPEVSILGFPIDPQPFQGKVIAVTEEAIVIRVKPTEFAVVDRQLATAVPLEGSKVNVIPYARHHFDGRRADSLMEKTEYLADGTPYIVRSGILGDATSKLPLPEPKCPELADLIEQLEKLTAPDGFRRIAHLLVDAGAHDFSMVDPEPDDIIRTPPAITFTVATSNFSGQVTLSYDRGADVYVIELHCNGQTVTKFDEVYFDCLGSTLEQLIADGHWRRIQIEVLSKVAVP